MPYCVIDLETTGKETFRRFCNQLDPRHYITLACFKYETEDNVRAVEELKDLSTPQERQDYLGKSLRWSDINVLIGQNLKFDVLWFWPYVREQLKKGLMLYDTITVEYLLIGQDKLKRLNLDTLASQYGGTLKDNRVTIMFREGMLAEDIPIDLLSEYCQADVSNTELIAKKQFKKIKDQGMAPLIKVYMQHYAALCDMEFNGLYIDVEGVKKKTEELQQQVNTLKEKLTQIALETSDWPKELPFDCLSTKHLTALLYGGTQQLKVLVELVDDLGIPLRYGPTAKKAGEIKTRWEIKTIDIVGYALKCPQETDKGNQSTNDLVLNALLTQKLSKEARSFIEILQQFREYNKLLTTYYYSEDAKGVQVGNLCGLHSDNCLHPNFNTAKAVTGRLSSGSSKEQSKSGVNAQNFDPSFLDYIVSRYGDEGIILDCDYSQLEVYVAAILANDQQLLLDLKNRVDLHTESAAFLFDIEVPQFKAVLADPEHELYQDYKKKRGTAKGLTFALLYGKYFKEDLEIKFKDYFYDKYSGLRDWHAQLEKQIQENAVVTAEPLLIGKSEERFIEGYKQKKSHLRTFTGKKYVFYNKAVKTSRGVFEYWHGPEIKDYPVQGTAADIIACQVGRFFIELLKTELRAKLINEVHDAIILDVHQDDLEEVKQLITKCLTDMEYLGKVFNYEFPIQFQIDIKSGKTWGECKRG